MKKVLIILLVSVLFLVSCSNDSKNTTETTNSTTTTEEITTSGIENITEVVEETTTEEEESDIILNYVLNEDKTFNEEKVKDYSSKIDTFTDENYYILYENDSTSPIFIRFMNNSTEEDIRSNTIEISAAPISFWATYLKSADGSMTWYWVDNSGNVIAFYFLFNIDGKYVDILNQGIQWQNEDNKEYYETLDITHLDNFYYNPN